MHIHIGHMFYGAGNFGDDLMLGGFLAGISAGMGRGLKLTCATRYDVEGQRRRFPQIEWSVYSPALRDALIAACDVWVGLGGSLLQPLDDHWLLADQLVQLQECRRRGKPAFFFGISADYRAEEMSPEVRALFDSVRWIWTREALSTEALHRMGFSRVTSGADLSHLALCRLPPAKPDSGATGFVCNFEVAGQYSIEALGDLIEAASDAGQKVKWLVQEVRSLPGSERDLLGRLPAGLAGRVALRHPDYGAPILPDLFAEWGRPARLFSTRFHGAIIGAWGGSRVVAFERQQKLRGIAQTLGITSFSELPHPRKLLDAFEQAQPVPRSVLDAVADLAQRCCTEFLTAAAEAVSAPAAALRPRIGDMRSMNTVSPPRVERHSLAGRTEVALDRVGPGLKRGEIFVVRGCLQAIDALEPLRAMILDTLEDVAGPVARAKAAAQGLTRLHDFVPIDQLMQMNPLLKQRSRLLAAGIIHRLAVGLLGLGPDVHFEDTPNVRIFIPHDVSAQHEAELKAYVQRRGSGGELTLHPPHQDSRHYHPTGAINIWCAIDNVLAANGMSVFPEFYGHELPCTKADGGVLPGQYLGRPVTMDLAPGDAWIFETLHLHGSTINQTDQTRFVISFRVTTDVPEYRSKPWYNYVRPSDCTAEGPPPNRIDYSKGQPDRGPVTLDTSNRLPPLVVSTILPNGDIEIPSGMVPEGEIRPVTEDLCVARIGGKPVTFYRGCPHEGADLAGGAIRDGRIMCVWHGLLMSPTDGRSFCRTLDALELVPCQERGGSIIIGRTAAADEVATPVVDPMSAAIDHFMTAADQFRTEYQTYRQGMGPQHPDRLGRARDAAIYALLGLPGLVIRTRLEVPVTRLITAILDSEISQLPRTAEQQASFAECCRRLGQGWGDDAGYSYGLAALALCWHGYELVGLRPLAQDLGWTEPFWLKSLLRAPPAFLHQGDADRFAESLAPLMLQIQERLERSTPEARQPLVTALLASDLYVQSYFNELDMRPAMLARARVIERLLTLEGARLDQLTVRQPSRRRPRIGFIALAIHDRTESVFLLAHMEHLARQHFDVRLYCIGDPAGRIGSLCRNAASRYVRLPDNILARTALLRGEDLDIAIFASNIAATPNAPVLLAAHRIARIQAMASWTPLTSGLRNMDVMISGDYAEPPGSEAHYVEHLVRLPGAHTCFPFDRMIEGQQATSTASRAELGIPDTAPVYISAAFGSKILPELSRCWIDILAQVPDAYLILLPFNPNWTKRYNRQALLGRLGLQLAEAGVSSDRIRILDALPTVSDLHHILSLADIYLDSFPYSGACSIYDPVTVGLPIVARAGQTCRSRQSYAMLREIGLEDWVTFDADGYTERAVRLGREPEFLAAEATRLFEVNVAGRPFTDTARYAAKLAPVLAGLVADWDRRTAELHSMPEAARADRVASLASRFGAQNPRFSSFDLLEEVVIPYLRATGRKRFVHAGSSFDLIGRPLIDDNWVGILFGPDGRPMSRPGTAASSATDISQLGTAAQIERMGFNDADLVVTEAGGNDFAILADLNFAAISPGLIMVSFNPYLPGQDVTTAVTILAGMRANGYRAAIFSRAVDAGTGLTRLAGISLDRLPAQPMAGTILFFRAADDGFVPSLLGWLEDVVASPADRRDAADQASLLSAEHRREATAEAALQPA